MSELINNGAKRKEQLKALILELHEGGNLEDIRRRFTELVGQVSSVEIAQMEQELIAEGLPVEEVRRLCDVHVSVFQEALSGEGQAPLPPGHPVHTFKYENFAANEVLQLLEESVAELPNERAFGRARQFVEQLSHIDRIYTRKENLLFPFLEKHGVGGPSAVMWGIHDDIRAQVKALRQALLSGEATHAQGLLPPLAETIRSMFYKEENILYPTSLRMLSEAEWLAIRDQSDEIGYCLIRPGDEWQPEVAEEEKAALPSYGHPGAGARTLAGAIPLDTGDLDAEQLNLLLTHLPVDVTFVDENDVVRYYSQGVHERIFLRTPSVIGRQVQNCHPPHSVHVVERLLDDFRRGKRDEAEFWITMNERFIHIRYYPLRNAEGTYRGCIEVTQDLTPLRALTGERRLMDEG